MNREDILERLNKMDMEAFATIDEDEAKSSALNEHSYHSFLYDYNEYVRMYGPHEETYI